MVLKRTGDACHDCEKASLTTSRAKSFGERKYCDLETGGVPFKFVSSIPFD